MGRIRKVFQLYNGLTDTEKQKFQQFLLMEEQNPQSIIVKLYDIIHLKRIHEEGKIWEQLYSGKDFNDLSMRKLFFKLATHFEKFLAYQGFSEDTIGQRSYLISELSKRPHLGSILVKSYKKFKRNPPNFKNASFYQRQFYLESIYRQHLLMYGHPKIIRSQQLQHKQAFDQWIINELFAFNFSNMSSDIGRTALDAIIPLIKDQTDKTELSTLYIQVYLAQRHPEKYLSTLLELIYQSADDFAHISDLINVSILTLNILIRHYNQYQAHENYQQVQDFYTWMIERKLIFLNGSLPWRHFRNLLRIKLRMNDIEEAQLFVEKYIHLLPEDEQKDAKTFSQGLIYYFAKDYIKAQRALLVPFKHITYGIEARFMGFESRYEQGERKELRKPLINLSRFIQRQEILKKEQKLRMITCIKFFKKLLNVHTKSGYRELYEKIKQSDRVYRSKWLIEKCQENL